MLELLPQHPRTNMKAYKRRSAILVTSAIVQRLFLPAMMTVVAVIKCSGSWEDCIGFPSNRDCGSPVLPHELRAGFQPLLSDASQKTRIPQGLWGGRHGNLQMVGIDDDLPSAPNLLGSLMDGNRFTGSHT